MHFRVWFEATLSHDTAKTFVLDAIGAGDSDAEEQSDLLGSVIGRYQDLADKLTKYSELEPYASEIAGFIHASGKKTLQQLIDFIAGLDNPETVRPKQAPSVGPGGLPTASSDTQPQEPELTGGAV